jgi:hypothetical protein
MLKLQPEENRAHRVAVRVQPLTLLQQASKLKYKQY